MHDIGIKRVKKEQVFIGYSKYPFTTFIYLPTDLDHPLGGDIKHDIYITH